MTPWNGAATMSSRISTHVRAFRCLLGALLHAQVQLCEVIRRKGTALLEHEVTVEQARHLVHRRVELRRRVLVDQTGESDDLRFGARTEDLGLLAMAGQRLLQLYPELVAQLVHRGFHLLPHLDLLFPR